MRKLILATAGVVLLAGCGGAAPTDDPSPSQPVETPKQAAERTPTATPTPVAVETQMVDQYGVAACELFGKYSEKELRDYRKATEVYVQAVASTDEAIHEAAHDVTAAAENIRDGEPNDWDGAYASLKRACESVTP
ncbi:hypothetical protein [Actinopolymorpha pittospori]|uniref:PBP1b-binding outer membrane lipoprotein LpoB n=1 Tax=Actinopolymorpha pittospori TaxID=648752 RepID=A0A927MX67_9ACTN|nr:hypothetical protein [Actinopolymorpha pittospori]MBE1608111.1 PBP1b-binding outer membrane lipoprotein LpoB [Actinopolymorpha pittospori]